MFLAAETTINENNVADPATMARFNQLSTLDLLEQLDISCCKSATASHTERHEPGPQWRVGVDLLVHILTSHAYLIHQRQRPILSSLLLLFLFHLVSYCETSLGVDVGDV